MSLEVRSIVTRVLGTCGETLQSIYSQEELPVPEGYDAVAFRSPKIGETYISIGGSAATAIKDFFFSPRVVISARTK